MRFAGKSPSIHGCDLMICSTQSCPRLDDIAARATFPCRENAPHSPGSSINAQQPRSTKSMMPRLAGSKMVCSLLMG